MSIGIRAYQSTRLRKAIKTKIGDVSVKQADSAAGLTAFAP